MSKFSEFADAESRYTASDTVARRWIVFAAGLILGFLVGALVF